MYVTKLLLIFSLLFCSQSLVAQHFMYESGKFSVAQSGYHKIELNEQIVNRLNASLGNIRVYDEKGQEIQYIVQSSNPISPSISQLNMPIYSKNVKAGCCTELILVNEKRLSIDNLLLTIKPFAATKTIEISGSTDHEQWFLLKDTFKIKSTEKSTLKITGLKRSDYQYIKVRVDDFDSEAIDISAVGFETSLFPKESYNLLQLPTITQTTFAQNADSITHIDFNFTEKQYINWLDFQFVANQAEYAYNIELQAKQDSADFFEHIQTFQFSPEKSSYLVLPKLYGQYFRFKIHNYKQKRLYVAGIQPYQLKYYLVANLAANKPYFLRFGGEHHKIKETINPIVSVEIPDSMDIVYPNNIKSIAKAGIVVEEENKNGGINSFTWLGIGVGAIMALLFAYFWVKRKKQLAKF
jgi:hypothetical protein